MNSVEQELSRLSAKLEAVEAKLASVGKQRVEWQTKESETGIQLAGGPTTITHTGTLLSVQLVMVGPGQANFIAVVRSDNSQVVMPIDLAAIRFLD